MYLVHFMNVKWRLWFYLKFTGFNIPKYQSIQFIVQEMYYHCRVMTMLSVQTKYICYYAAECMDM